MFDFTKQMCSRPGLRSPPLHLAQLYYTFLQIWKPTSPHMEVFWTSRFPLRRSSGQSAAPRPRIAWLHPKSTTWWSTRVSRDIYWLIVSRCVGVCVSLTCAQLRFVSWPFLWPDSRSAPSPAASFEERWIGMVGTEDPHYGKHWKGRIKCPQYHVNSSQLYTLNCL